MLFHSWIEFRLVSSGDLHAIIRSLVWTLVNFLTSFFMQFNEMSKGLIWIKSSHL